MRYTFSDDEEDSDDFPTRKSTRNSGVSTPAEPTGPTVTASGRHVKSRLGGMYGETMLMDQRKELEHERDAAIVNGGGSERDHHQDEEADGRAQRSGGRPRRETRAPRRIDDSSDELNGDSDRASSASKEWSGNEEEPDDDNPDVEEFDTNGDGDEEVDDDAQLERGQDSLVVQLRYKREAEKVKVKGRVGLGDGGSTAAAASAADCIAVDSGWPGFETGKDAVQLNGKASGEDEVHPPPNAFFQAKPMNDINGIS